MTSFLGLSVAPSVEVLGAQMWSQAHTWEPRSLIRWDSVLKGSGLIGGVMLADMIGVGVFS